jgi:NAD+ kinase
MGRRNLSMTQCGSETRNHLLQSIAILYHPRRKRAVEEAEWLANELGKRGVRTSIGSGWDEHVVERLCGDRQLLAAFGGDGTIIHVARLAAPYGVPLVGINLGRVGFLAELTPEDLPGRVDDLVEQKFWIERRTMLDVDFHSSRRVDHFLCLNELGVTRGLAPRAAHVHTQLDGRDFMTYTADGVLVATATGSTAYSLAAGGPILYPESNDFIITPVAPHLHIGRSMIVPGDTRVTLTIPTDRPAVVSVDGADEQTMRPDDRVDVCRSAQVASFARFGPRDYFYTAIAARLK